MYCFYINQEGCRFLTDYVEKGFAAVVRGVSDWACEGVTAVVPIASAETTWKGDVYKFYAWP